MADAVTTTVLHAGSKRYAVHLTNISDGNGESAVTKIDISGLTAVMGGTPTKAQVEYIEWYIQGFTSVRLLWDRGTDVLIAALPAGSGARDFSLFGGKHDTGSGGTGDVLLTTDGAVSGATYDIMLVVRLER